MALGNDFWLFKNGGIPGTRGRSFLLAGIAFQSELWYLLDSPWGRFR
jgi:hypothetical protein